LVLVLLLSPTLAWRPFGKRVASVGDAALADYMAAVHDPTMIQGMCEDYRAAATIDLVHDRASRQTGERIECPMLVLWGDKGKIGTWYDPLEVWRRYVIGAVDGGGLASGHYLAEEAAGTTADRLMAFMAG